MSYTVSVRYEFHLSNKWIALLFAGFVTLLLSGGSVAWAQAMAKHIDGLPLPWSEALEKSLHTPTLEKQGIKGAQLRYAASDDAAVIREWLRSEGFLDAVVNPDTSDGKPIHWRVEAGTRWQIGEVLAEPIAPGPVKLPATGAWFRSEDYETAKTALRGAWTDAGYLRAAFAESAVYPDHLNKRVRIVWRIEPGNLYHIATLDVMNTAQYHPDLARRLSLLHEGDVPSAAAIRAAIRNISNDSHYRSASVLPVLPEGDGDRVPMRIDVVEADRYVLSGTAGYSTDGGPEGGAAWSDHGIAGGLFEYGVQGSMSRTASGAGINIARPVWPGLRDKTGLSLNYLREDTAGQRFDTVSGGPFWLHQFDERETLRIEVRQNWIAGGGERIRMLEPGFSLRMDRRIGEGVPQGGWKGGLNMSLPLQTNGKGRWFVSHLDMRTFHSLGKLLATPRIGYGRSVALVGVVPKTLRQYGGGSGSVRGYKLDSLGPVGPDALAQGGLQSANAGLDLLWTANEQFAPVVFSDVGQVWNTPQSREKPVWSLGFGIIAQTPAGPVRADISFPQVRRQQDANFQIYISFGEVF